MTQAEQTGKGVRKARRGSIQGFRNRLNIRGNLDPNYEYRIVNDYDEGDRIARFMENDWEVVNKSDIEVGDKRINKPTPEGTPVKISVGQGTQAYLMRKRKEWYEEDQQYKQAEIDKHESQQQPHDTYGKIDFNYNEVKR